MKKNVKKITLLLLFTLSVSSLLLSRTTNKTTARTIPLPDLTAPDSITVDKDQIYITQFPDVFIYSSRDFGLVRRFGKKGAGPREFLKFAVLTVKDNQLVISDRGKVLTFSRDGEFISGKKAQSIMHWGGIPAGDFFLVKSKANKNKVEFDTVNIYDGQLKKVKEIFRYPFFYQPRGSKKCDAVNFRNVDFQVWEGQIFIRNEEGSGIHVFDLSGKKRYTVGLDYEKVKITEQDKKMYHDYFQTTRPWKNLYAEGLKNEIKFPGYFPAIQLFCVADGKIYLLTYKRQKGKSEFIIIDIKGKPLKKVFLPFWGDDAWFHYSLRMRALRAAAHPTFTVKDNTLYQLVENPDSEEWELRIHNID